MNRFSYLLIVALLIAGLALSFALRKLDRLRETENAASAYSPAGGPRRVICTAPSVVETVYALGEENRIVGVSDFSTYPPQVLLKEKIGGMMNPDIEKILSLRPDLMILQGSMEKYVDLCREKHIALLRVDMENLQSIYAGMQSIGDALGCSNQATALIQSIQAQLQQLRERALAHNHQPAVFLCLSRRIGSLSGLYTISAQSFIAELLQMAGGENIFADAPGRYPQISKESLLKRNPEMILELRPDEETRSQSSQELRGDWQAMPGIRAVASGRIYSVTDDFILIPGPRIVQTAERFYELIHGGDK